MIVTTLLWIKKRPLLENISNDSIASSKGVERDLEDEGEIEGVELIEVSVIIIDGSSGREYVEAEGILVWLA